MGKAFGRRVARAWLSFLYRDTTQHPQHTQAAVSKAFEVSTLASEPC